MTYIRDGIFSIDFVLKNISDKQSMLINNHVVNMDSKRYKTFRKSGVRCKHCGIKAKYFALERHKNVKDLHPNNRYHFNLYGFDKNGNEVMFTKDHIIPKSKGGGNGIKNFQTLCRKCNQKKGDMT